MRTRAAVLALVAVVLVAGGAFAYLRFTAPAEDAAVALVPKSSVIYGNLFIRPSNDQKMALDDLLQKFPGVENTDDALDKLIELIDAELGKEGLSYEDDIEPWLGDQVAGFMMPGGTPEMPNFGVLVESKDDEALRDLVERIRRQESPDAEIVERDHDGTTYEVVEGEPGSPSFAFLDGFFVAGTEEAVTASIDAQDGEDLQASERYREATEGLRDDWLGLFYMDGGAMLSLFDDEMQMTPEEKAVMDSFGLDSQSPTAAVAYVTSDTIGFEGSGGMPEEGPLAGFGSFAGSGLLPELPAESWAAFGVPDVGRLGTSFFELFAEIPGFDRSQIDSQFTAETGLDLENDVLSWMGDAGLFVQGRNVQEIGGGLVVESSDPAKTAAALDTAEELLVREGLQPRPVSQGGLEGFSIQAPGMPAPIYFLGGERLVITYGQTATDQITSPDETLEEAETFGTGVDALGTGFDVSFYLDVDAAQAFAESVMSFSGQTDPVYDQDVRPYLEPFGYMIAGSREEGDTVVSRFVVGVP